MTQERPTIEELDRLSTDELRERAFAKAEDERDLGFFWDLVRHLPAAEDIATEDGSAGAIGGTISEAITGLRELFDADALGDLEPLFRARFIDYLRS